jgi:hypothetical protein
MRAKIMKITYTDSGDGMVPIGFTDERGEHEIALSTIETADVAADIRPVRRRASSVVDYQHRIIAADKPVGLIEQFSLQRSRAFLNAGVMEDGLVRPVDEGTPQSGPLSLILSNVVLDDLDKELARRGHRFCRYADDCNIYVRSGRAGERVMASVGRFLTNKLRLKVNEAKSAVAPGVQHLE